LGSSTAFTSTDIFELGQQNVVDVCDDVPAVSITLDTNEWGDINTVATLAGVDKTGFNTTAVAGNANLVTMSGTTGISYYHGVALSNFGASNWFDLWSPVQSEASLGTAANTIDQTLYLPKCYVNNLELGYSTGNNATENYGAETDTKYWFLNDGRFVSQEQWNCSGDLDTVTLGLKPTASGVAQLSDSSYAFLYSTTLGERALCHETAAGAKTYYAVDTAAATATKGSYNVTTNVVTLPTGLTTASGDFIKIRYAANAYADDSGDSDVQHSNYFTPLADGDTTHVEDIGAVRQGQIELYLVDPDVVGPGGAYDMALRITSATITAAMTREALNELGHLKPYDRPLTFPVEITTSVETTAGDLETFAMFAGKSATYDAGTLKDITINHLMVKDNLVLVVMIYQQTDETAGGTGALRKVLESDMVGTEYFVRGVRAVYAAINPASPEREYPLKTVIVPGLKATSENQSTQVGQNSSLSLAFRSTNKLFIVKGFVPVADVVCTPGLQVNV
jgi:hypothetical protein